MTVLPSTSSPHATECRQSATISKRVVDVAGALVGLAVGFPMLMLAAIAIRLETEGPVLFKQERVGRSGKPFTLYKLRGMYVDARQRFPQLYRYHYSAQEADALKFHVDGDPRVTRVGALL